MSCQGLIPLHQVIVQREMSHLSSREGIVSSHVLNMQIIKFDKPLNVCHPIQSNQQQQ